MRTLEALQDPATIARTLLGRLQLSEVLQLQQEIAIAIEQERQWQWQELRRQQKELQM